MKSVHDSSDPILGTHKSVLSYLWFLSLLEERLAALGFLRLLLLGEVVWFRDSAYCLLVHSLEIYLGCSRDDISGINSSERNAIDFEGPGDEEGSFGKMFEEDDALAPETASEEDDNSARLERWSRSGGVN